MLHAIGRRAKNLRETPRLLKKELDLQKTPCPGSRTSRAGSAILQSASRSMRLFHRMVGGRSGAAIAGLGPVRVHFEHGRAPAAPLPDALRAAAARLGAG